MIRLVKVIAILLFSLNLQAQSIQLHGKLLFPESDSVEILVYHNGKMVAFEITADPFYSMILGEHAHYIIHFRSGSKEKFCHLICYNMDYESIQVDVDFRSEQSIILYKKRPRDKSYIVLRYGSGMTRETEIPEYK